MKSPAVYIMTNRKNGTLYVGVTSDLVARVWQHREKQVEVFSKRYNLAQLVWFELHSTMEYAILREKQLKAGNRLRKCELIEVANSNWSDLWSEIAGGGHVG